MTPVTRKIRDGPTGAPARPSPLSLFRGSSLRKASSLDVGWQGAALERRTADPGKRSEEHIGHHSSCCGTSNPLWGSARISAASSPRMPKYPSAISFALPAFCPAVRARTRSEVLDLEGHDIAATKLAIDGQIEHGQIAGSSIHEQSDVDRWTSRTRRELRRGGGLPGLRRQRPQARFPCW
jgi:hypothetical protein